MPKVAERTTIVKAYKMYPDTIDKVKEVQELYKKMHGEKITQAKLLDMALDMMKKQLA